jgi:hypothetical protein
MAGGLVPTVVPAEDLHRLAHDVDGIVGQDFLSAFNYTLDYRAKRLRWTMEPPEEFRARLPLVRQGGRQLVKLRGKSVADPIFLVPDSGADGFVVFERNGRTAVDVDYVAGFVRVGAVAGSAVARAAVARELRMGTVTLRDHPVVVLRRDDDRSSLEGDGLLPLHHFSSVSFNNSESYLVVRR